MKSLVQRLGGRHLADVVWYTPENGEVTIGDLLASVQSLRTAEWRGQRIALDQMPTSELALALIVLDGLADVLLLLPTDEAAATRDRRLRDARIERVLGPGTFKAERAGSPLNGDDHVPQELYEGLAEAHIPTTWLLPTSGTTGTPKLIPHSVASLSRSMSDKFVGARHVWGSLYSLRRFAGLQVFLQSWLAGTPLVLIEDGCGLDVLLTNLIARKCTALSGTPSMWKKMSMHPLFDALKVQQITLGGEIVDQAVLDMLARRQPAARITHIYASTEAGVGFVVRDGRAGFPLDYLDLRHGGVTMGVSADMNLMFRRSANDEQPESEWIDSGDVVKINGDRVLFLGRANGSINVGGNKVMPEEVEQVIDELPEVAFVQVRPRKSTILGSLVEAAIIPSAGFKFDAAFKKLVLAHCRIRLEPFKVPVFIVEAGDIVLTTSGKIMRGPVN